MKPQNLFAILVATFVISFSLPLHPVISRTITSKLEELKHKDAEIERLRSENNKSQQEIGELKQRIEDLQQKITATKQQPAIVQKPSGPSEKELNLLAENKSLKKKFREMEVFLDKATSAIDDEIKKREELESLVSKKTR